MKRPAVPYGYQIINGKAVPHPEESRKLRDFFNYYTINGCSVAEAAARAEIEMTTCRQMLTNRVYLGTDYYPQLITPDLMEKTEEAVRERSFRRGWRRSSFRPIAVRTQFIFTPGKAPSASRLYELIQPAQ